MQMNVFPLCKQVSSGLPGKWPCEVQHDVAEGRREALHRKPLGGLPKAAAIRRVMEFKQTGLEVQHLTLSLALEEGPDCEAPSTTYDTDNSVPLHAAWEPAFPPYFNIEEAAWKPMLPHEVGHSDVWDASGNRTG